MKTATHSLVLLLACRVGFCDDAPAVSTIGATKSVRFFLPAKTPGVLRARVERVDLPGGVVEARLTIPSRLGVDEAAKLGNRTVLAIARRNFRSYEGAVLAAAEVDRMADGRVRLKVAPGAAERIRKGNPFDLYLPDDDVMQAIPPMAIIVDKTRLIPGMPARELKQLEHSRENLRRLAVAVHDYHDDHAHLPPRTVLGPDGKPWHGWRVLLLPYLKEQELYDRYRFDEPWNGPNNGKLVAEMPAVFHDPIHGEPGRDGFTHYAAAENALLRTTNFNGRAEDLDVARRAASRFRDVTDGTANTILFGSVSPGARIPWTKPEDVPLVDGKVAAIGAKAGFAAPYEGKAGQAGVFVLCDGTVRTITMEFDRKLLAQLLLNDGRPMWNWEFPSLDRVGPGDRTRLAVEIDIRDDGANASIDVAPPAPADER